MPASFQPLLSAHSSLTSAETKATTAVNSFKEAQAAIQANVGSALPIKAAQLGSLLSSLESAEGSVAQSIKAREQLLSSLESILRETKSALQKDEEQLDTLRNRKVNIEGEKNHIEDLIVRGVTSEDAYEPPRPDMEPLTPPPAFESITPVGSPMEVPSESLSGLNGEPEEHINKKRRLEEVGAV